MSLSGNRPIAKKYKLGKELGKGSFGIVHLGTDITSGDEVAIKLERVKSKHPQLLYESRIYRALQGGEGVPSLKWFGTEASHNILIIDYLGPSLEDLFSAMHRKFTPLTVVMIGEQMVQRIEFMHSRHFIHRDIKPDNFLSGRGRRASTLYIIDFGLSKRYRHPKSKKHMAYREGKNLTGTPRYASINNHLGVEQSRRDDMESIGYVLIYFARGALPWQGLKANTKKQKYQKIMDKKMSVAIPALCNKVPVELKKYIEYCRSLRFEDKPNYPYLKTLFQEAARSGKYGDPSQGFDWLKGSPAKSGTSTGSNRAAPRPPRQNNVDPNVMRSSRFPDGKRGMMPGSARQNMSMNNVQSQVSNIPMNLPVPPSARISARKELANSGHYEDSFDHEYDH